MILCDPELSVGLSTPGSGKAGVASRGRRGAWTPVGVSGQPGSADACVFGREDARELAGKGHEIALKVKEGFAGIVQEMYKVCLCVLFLFQKKMPNLVVGWNRSQLLPRMICRSYSSRLILLTVCPSFAMSFFFLRLMNRQRYLAETLKINLKDVGTNLVASLSLLSEFSKAISEVADWWSSVKDNLASEEPSLLVPTSSQHGDEAGQGVGNIESEKFGWWSEMKDDFQEYYDVVSLSPLSPAIAIN